MTEESQAKNHIQLS